jgi:hypothetical protein
MITKISNKNKFFLKKKRRLKQREEEVNIYKEQLTTLQIERYDA